MGSAALGRDYSVTDGGGGREGVRPMGSLFLLSPSLDIIQDHCHSLYKPNSFFVVGRGRRERERRENHASEATLCLASHTGPGSVCVFTSKLRLLLLTSLTENQRIVSSSRFANILVHIRIVLNDSCHGPPSESVGCTCMPSFLPSS